MPCLNGNHHHRPWPRSGSHDLVIESCETRCGWCSYTTGAANNLRVHARRHIRNPSNTDLRHINIVVLRSGRSRVTSQAAQSCSAQGAGQTQPHIHDTQPPKEATSHCGLNEETKQLSYEDLLAERDTLSLSVQFIAILLHAHGLTCMMTGPYDCCDLTQASLSELRDHYEKRHAKGIPDGSFNKEFGPRISPSALSTTLNRISTQANNPSSDLSRRENAMLATAAKPSEQQSSHRPMPDPGSLLRYNLEKYSTNHNSSTFPDQGMNGRISAVRHATVSRRLPHELNSDELQGSLVDTEFGKAESLPGIVERSTSHPDAALICVQRHLNEQGGSRLSDYSADSGDSLEAHAAERDEQEMCPSSEYGQNSTSEKTHIQHQHEKPMQHSRPNPNRVASYNHLQPFRWSIASAHARKFCSCSTLEPQDDFQPQSLGWLPTDYNVNYISPSQDKPSSVTQTTGANSQGPVLASAIPDDGIYHTQSSSTDYYNFSS